MDTTPLLVMEQVSKGYEAARGKVAVLRGVSFAVRRGESIAVTGPSGSGKSTLLNIAGALDRPDSGRVVVGGQDLSALSDRDLAGVRNRRIGFVFQLHHLLPQCTVLENVLMPAVALGKEADWEAVRERADRLLQRVGLAAHRDERPAQLSGGERQRTAVVRALINRPGLVLADEPTGSLDEATAETLVELLVELQGEEELALLVVTHAESVAARMGRRLRLHAGTLSE
jgi:ABC-type lipoprotein export system ATPase subunit